MEIREKIKFLYTIYKPGCMQIYFSTDPFFAQEASNNGCLVKARTFPGRIYRPKND